MTDRSCRSARSSTSAAPAAVPAAMGALAALTLACGSTMPGVAADAATAAASPEAARKLFVGCPVYRDTDAGRKSGCWLVTDPADGVRYDVTLGRIKPILGRKVLVEGTPVAKDGELCGGVVLEPVDVSVLADEECKPFLIPAEGHPGRRFELSARVMQPSSVPRVLPPPPYEPREFTILFEHDSDFLVYQYAEVIIEDAVIYAKASRPQRVTITGYAATSPSNVSGSRIVERAEIAEARARMVAEAFTRLGVARERLELRWEGEPADALAGDGGLALAGKRRVTIRIEPGTAPAARSGPARAGHAGARAAPRY